MAGGWGGRRNGAGRPKGSPGLKSEALASRLEEMGYDPAETLVRLGRRAEEAGEIELAIKAAVALMSFRWPKLKESSVDLGLGLSNGLAGQLEAARARIEISVCSGIDRPPDDAGAIDATPVPPAPPPIPSPAESPPKRPSATTPASPPAPESPAPPQTPGKAIPAHQYWSQVAKPER